MPRRGGGWLSQRDESYVEERYSHFVIPSAAEGSFSFPVAVFLHKAVCMKHRAPQLFGVRCFPLSDFLPFFPDLERKRFLACARNDNMGKAAFSDLPPSSGRRDPEGAEVGSPYELIRHVRGFPLSAFLTFLPHRERKGFLAFARNDDMRSGFVLHPQQTKTALRGRALQSGFWFYYSTVTDFARFLGLSTSFPLLIEV